MVPAVGFEPMPPKRLVAQEQKSQNLTSYSGKTTETSSTRSREAAIPFMPMTA